MSIGRVLSISQEDKCEAILMSKVPRTYGRHFLPVGFIPVFRFYPSLPMVKNSPRSLPPSGTHVP